MLPFALLLLAIAVLPLATPHRWEKNGFKGLVVAVLAAPVFVYRALAHREALAHTAVEYFSLVVLLGSLFVVAGGIHVGGDLLATPGRSTAILAAGAVLANVVGTTGASMLLVRLVLRANGQRKNVSHIPLFFVLVVSNAGGLLTPLGDPPCSSGTCAACRSPGRCASGPWGCWPSAICSRSSTRSTAAPSRGSARRTSRATCPSASRCASTAGSASPSSPSS